MLIFLTDLICSRPLFQLSKYSEQQRELGKDPLRKAVSSVDDKVLVVDGTSASVRESREAFQLHGDQEGQLEGQHELTTDDANRRSLQRSVTVQQDAEGKTRQTRSTESASDQTE